MRVTLDSSYQNHNTMFTGNQFIQNQVLSIFSSSRLRKQSSTYGLNPHPTRHHRTPLSRKKHQPRGGAGGTTPSPWQYHPPRPSPFPSIRYRGEAAPSHLFPSLRERRGTGNGAYTDLTKGERLLPVNYLLAGSTHKTLDKGLWANGGKCPCFCLLHRCPLCQLPLN